jgi:alpha-2-macroglobulin
MKKKWIILLGALALAVVITFVLFFVGKGSKSSPKARKDYSSYISAYTSGTVSVKSTVQVVFASNVASYDMFGQPADKKIMAIKPSLNGSLVWVDERTLEFTPEGDFAQDKEYKVRVALSRLFQQIPKEYEEFEFTFRTIKQHIEVRVIGLEFYDDPKREDRRIAGKLITADWVDADKVTSTIKATQEGTIRKITWESSGDGTTHNFWVEEVAQGAKDGILVLDCSGSPIGIKYTQSISVDIPAKGLFRVLSHEVFQAPEQSVEIRFSEILDPKQNLDGLVVIRGLSNLKFLIEGNILRVYPESRASGSFDAEVMAGVKNSRGQKMAEGVTLTIMFEKHKPQLRFLSEGVIVPSSGGLLLPFQSVSLRAVDVKVIRIFEQNIAQFLQVNSLSGQGELRRVGRMILSKTIRLDQAGQVDFNQWNTFDLDLSTLVQVEPGAIYQVTLSYKREYSSYTCEGVDNDQPIEMKEVRFDNSDDQPQSYYYYDDYDYDEEYSYNWSDRDDPCKPSYYHNKIVKKNVLASDLGIIAKSGSDGSYLFAVSSLTSAQPMGGVTLELLNYQQQVVATATTDNNGMAIVRFPDQQRPFLLVAKSGKQKGYLKLDQGSSLSLSSFDVSGVAVQKGLKGFIYGERGVWRPGDTLFISFILEDRGKTLPQNHPVSFELTNPRGQQVYKTVATTGTEGMYAFPVATGQDDPTGTYVARIRVGGASFSEAFKVETIMPNRLKINIDFDKEALYFGQDNRATVQSNWLHGAPARNLKVRVDATMNQSSTAFKGFDGYSFDDPARTFSAEEQTVFDGTLDEKGSVSFTPSISVGTAAPGVLRANFTVRVFEEGGAFSIDRFSMPYYPYRTFVGLKMPNPGTRGNMFFTDTTYALDIVTLSSNGTPQPQRNVTVEVYKIDWRWWWDRSSDDLSSYISGSYRRPIQKGSVTTDSKGMAKFNVRVNHPDWGRFFVRVVDVTGGHAAGTTLYYDWPGWVKRDKKAQAQAATMLVFATDKDKYNVGEIAQITIPTSEGGKVFLTVENGVKVLQSTWIDAKANETRYSLPITSDMTPNVYICATLVQPHGQASNDLPIRMYGIVPVLVEDPKTILEPIIQMPDELQPEKMVTISVSEKSGNAMAFTLAMVDDGLLDLTRFGTPDPWRSFYAREALGVRSWDLYDLVMGASSGRMQRIISVGGDEGAVDKGDRSANRFKPVVRYFGPFEVGKGKKHTISFTMPNYIGSVRTMVIAAKEGAYGNASKTTPVRTPLMVLATLPRVLGPQEEVVLPVAVFAMDKKVKQVKVRVEANSLLTVVGGDEQTLQFDDIGDKVVRFNLKVASKLGIAKVKVIAQSGNEVATNEIELDVRNANPPMTITRDTMIKANDTWKMKYNAFGIEGTNFASVEVSTLPPVNLGRRLHYLIGYPHGCLEQTVSKAFPQLFIGKLAETDDNTRKASEDNVRFALDRIRAFRTSDGSLSLWPGGEYYDSWATIYAGHFMLEAQKMGYTVSSSLIDGWKSSQRKMAQNWTPNREGYYTSDLIQAYRLYTLALAKAPEVGAMNRLRELPKLSTQARWRLASAYALVGNMDAARKLIDNVPTTIDKYRELSYTYGSDFRDMAMIVESLVLLGDNEKAMPLLRQLSLRLSTDSWLSTQETAMALLAYSKFAAANPASDGIDVHINAQGASKRITSKMSMVQHIFTPVQSGSGSLEVKNGGKGAIFARLIQHGVPVSGNEIEQASGIQMDVSYALMNGLRLNPTAVNQGTDFYVEIKVSNPGTRGNLEQLILSFVAPSGWEIRTSRLDQGQSALESSVFEYQDIRDDRVYTYFNLSSGSSKVFRIRLNAAYQGRFYMPGIACEAMYDNSVNARKKGDWVSVDVP